MPIQTGFSLLQSPPMPASMTLERLARWSAGLALAASINVLPAAAADVRPEVAQARPAASKAASAPDPLAAIGARIAERLRIRSVAPASVGVARVVARSDDVGAGGGAVASARPGKPVHAAASVHWGYEGAEGPQSWARMRPEYAQCAKGSRQSPIDIQGGIRVQLEPVAFDYKAGAFQVVDNGHTVQVNVAAGSSIEVMGRRFELLQFHFHRPSEERVDGRQFDMVVHLVHKDLEGRLAVVSVLLERGSAQPVVQSVWNNLPLEKGDAVAARALLDPAGLLPTERSYYTYMGSLTTPPCSEGVLWMVMKKPMPISAEQIDIFARLYPMNARPIQAASGRLIKESE